MILCICSPHCAYAEHMRSFFRILSISGGVTWIKCGTKLSLTTRLLSIHIVSKITNTFPNVRTKLKSLKILFLWPIKIWFMQKTRTKKSHAWASLTHFADWTNRLDLFAKSTVPQLQKTNLYAGEWWLNEEQGWEVMLVVTVGWFTWYSCPLFDPREAPLLIFFYFQKVHF